MFQNNYAGLSHRMKFPTSLTGKLSRNAHRFLPVIVLAFTVSGCMEVASTEYADRNHAISRDAIGKSKWLPEWLPKDAVDIREAHDMDTNESWLIFRPTSGTLTLPEDCRPTGRAEMPDAPTMRRFPQFARNSWSRASDHAGVFYSCPERSAGRWIMHDEELGLVYSRVKY